MIAAVSALRVHLPDAEQARRPGTSPTVRHSDGFPDLLAYGVPFPRAQTPRGNVLRLAHSRAGGRLQPGGAGSVWSTGLPGGMKELALWLPRQTPCGLRAESTAHRGGGWGVWVGGGVRA